jgi:MFS family permease
VSTFYPCVFLSTVSHFGISGLAPGFGAIAQEFHVGPDKLSWLISICLLGTFIGVYSVALLIDRFGRRPVWLFAALWLLVCSTWAAVAQSYTSLLLARLLASVSAGISEPISVSTVNDLFFLHERGTQNGVQSIFLSMGASISPVITGFLIQSKGWRWYHWLLSILAGFDLLWIFFCTSETRYHRDFHQALDVAGAHENTDQPGGDDNHVTKVELSHEEGNKSKDNTDREAIAPIVPKKRTYLQELKPWSPLVKDANELAAFLRAWATWSYLSVVWVVLSWSLHVST